MAIKLSAPKKDGQDLTPEQIEAARSKPFPIKWEFDGVEWEVWVDFRRVSPALANEYVVAYSKGLLAGKKNEPMKREILALATQLKNFGQIEAATDTPKARKGKSKVEVAPEPEAMLTMADVEAVSELTEDIKLKTGEYTLAQIVAVGDQQTELYLTECAVVAAAIIRLDDDGEVAAHGAPAINYPGFDPTFENLTATGQLAPALVRAIMVEFHPTSAASRGTTPATKAANSGS